MNSHESPEPEPQDPVTFVFRKPFLPPGSPEAQRAGCRCSFERNMQAAFLAAEGHAPEDQTMFVVHDECPLHKIIRKPMDDALGDI